MAAAIEETDRRRGIQEAYNQEHGIEPTTIVKGIHDLNERLRVVAEGTVVYTSEREELAGRALTLENTAAIEKLVARMEAEMRAAAKELEFERAAALRDEIQQIRLRVLEQDQSVIVGRAAERAARRGSVDAGDRADSQRRRRSAAEPRSRSQRDRAPADEEPAANLDGEPASTRTPRPTGCRASATSTTTKGRLAGPLARPADLGPNVTPNVRRRTGTPAGAAPLTVGRPTTARRPR